MIEINPPASNELEFQNRLVGRFNFRNFKGFLGKGERSSRGARATALPPRLLGPCPSLLGRAASKLAKLHKSDVSHRRGIAFAFWCLHERCILLDISPADDERLAATVSVVARVDWHHRSTLFAMLPLVVVLALVGMFGMHF